MEWQTLYHAWHDLFLFKYWPLSAATSLRPFCPRLSLSPQSISCHILNRNHQICRLMGITIGVAILELYPLSARPFAIKYRSCDIVYLSYRIALKCDMRFGSNALKQLSISKRLGNSKPISHTAQISRDLALRRLTSQRTKLSYHHSGDNLYYMIIYLIVVFQCSDSGKQTKCTIYILCIFYSYICT